MKRDSKRRKKIEAGAPPVTQDEDKFMELKERLLPGIPNDVSLGLIVTKLPSINFHNLASASHAWRQAIQDGHVHDSRLRSHSTDKFLVVNYSINDVDNWIPRSREIVVYSLRDTTCYRIPPIPDVMCGIPWGCRFIVLDPKIYVLGGSTGPGVELHRKEVYVFDWAGQRQWNQCASMQEARRTFGCAAKDGKIYVFGGTSLREALGQSEVYDPRVNAWSAITSMGHSHFMEYTAVIGEEIVLYGGLGGGLRYRNGLPEFAYGMTAYHPVTDNWRVPVSGLSKEGLDKWHIGSCFVAQGNFYTFSMSKIHVYDTENKTWKERHSCSLSGHPSRLISPLSVLAVDNEVIAMVRVNGISYFVQSRGFDSENHDIVLEQLPCPLSFQGWSFDIMGLLEL